MGRIGYESFAEQIRPCYGSRVVQASIKVLSVDLWFHCASNHLVESCSKAWLPIGMVSLLPRAGLWFRTRA